MSSILVTGNKPLQGEVEISGSVNSALKLIVASLFTTEDVYLSNIPNVEFLQAELKILKELGGEYEWLSKNFLKINNSKLNSSKIPLLLGKDLLTSFLFAGPLLYRFGEAQIPIPGSGIDSISRFISTWSMLNIEVNYDREFVYLRSDNSKAGRIELERPSQMDTTNALFCSIFLNGNTTVINTSEDYEIDDLIEFLNSVGAEIKKENKKVVNIEGKDHFRSSNYACISDTSEAVFFSVLSLVTNGNILIRNIEKKNLSIFISLLNKIGANYEFVGEDSLRVWRRGEAFSSFDLDLNSYSNNITNYVPYLIFLALKCEGISKFISETYKDKYHFIFVLNKFNAKIKMYDTGKDYQPCEIYVKGVADIKMNDYEIENFTNSPVILLSALTNESQVEILHSEKLEYMNENLIQKVVELGGQIKYD